MMVKAWQEWLRARFGRASCLGPSTTSLRTGFCSVANIQHFLFEVKGRFLVTHPGTGDGFQDRRCSTNQPTQSRPGLPLMSSFYRHVMLLQSVSRNWSVGRSPLVRSYAPPLVRPMVEPTSAALPAGDGARGVGDDGATSPAPAPPAPVLTRPVQYPKNVPLVEIGTTFEVVGDATGATIEVRRTGLLTFHCSMDGCVAKFEVHTKNLASMKTHARSKHKPTAALRGGGGRRWWSWPMAIVAVAAREAASQKPTRSSQAKGARSQGGRAWPSWVPEVPYKKKPTSWPF